MRTSFKKGQWVAQCDICDEKFHSSDLKKRWDGLYVCKLDYEVRHPMDFQKGIKDDPSVPWTRPVGTDTETDASGWAAVDSVPSGTFDNNL